MPTRHNMKMDMKDRLAGGGAIKLKDLNPFWLKGRTNRPRDGLSLCDQVSEIIGRQVEKIDGLRFRNDLGVSQGLREGIHKGQGPCIFENARARDFTAQDLRKNIAVFIAKIKITHL